MFILDIHPQSQVSIFGPPIYDMAWENTMTPNADQLSNLFILYVSSGIELGSTFIAQNILHQCL
jgi:hypothetical protein